MTRLDTINVEALTDQHLLSNYREIGRLSAKSRFPKSKEKWPLRYKMEEGHMKFFYDKGEWLAKRQAELYNECMVRGFDVVKHEYRAHPAGLNKDWEADDSDHSVSIGRILERIDHAKKPYRYGGQPITKEQYIDILKDYGYTVGGGC